MPDWQTKSGLRKYAAQLRMALFSEDAEAVPSANVQGKKDIPIVQSKAADVRRLSSDGYERPKKVVMENAFDPEKLKTRLREAKQKRKRRKIFSS